MINIERIDFINALEASLLIAEKFEDKVHKDTEWTERVGLFIEDRKLFVYATDGILFVRIEVPIYFEEDGNINIGDGIVPHLLATSYGTTAIKTLIKDLQSFEEDETVEFFSHNPGKFYLNNVPSFEHSMCFKHSTFEKRLYERCAALKTKNTCKNGFLWNYEILHKLCQAMNILQKDIFWYFSSSQSSSTKDSIRVCMFESEDGLVRGYVMPLRNENNSSMKAEKPVAKKQKQEAIISAEDFDDI